MLFLIENAATTGHPLQAFFPKSIVPKKLSTQAALEQLADHDNLRYAKTAAALLELCSKYQWTEFDRTRTFMHSNTVHSYYRSTQKRLPKRLTVMLLNSNLQLLTEVTLSVEVYEASMECQLEILRLAVKNRAERIILVQSRRVETPKLSFEEREGWYRLNRCAQVLNIEVLDYLILGRKSAYFSMNLEDVIHPYSNDPDAPCPVDYW